jgi:hypothetical protein
MKISERLKAEIDMWEGVGHPALMQRFVLRNGVEIDGSKYAGKRGYEKMCFMNAAMSTHFGNSEYCEGYGWRENLPILIHHAWRVQNGKVLDETWDRPEECQYMGVIFPKDVMKKEIKKNKSYGLLDTGRGINIDLIFRMDPELKVFFEDFKMNPLTFPTS